MSTRVFVIGVGMTKFIKPGRDDNPDYPQLAAQATQRALRDAGVSFKQIEMAAIGYVYGDSTCGQRALYEVGMSGIPIYNVNNNCSTGSTALHLAHGFIKGKQYECVLALGFEKMEKGSLTMKYPDRTNPLDKHVLQTMEIGEKSKAPFAPQIFGNAGIEHMKKFGTRPDHFAKIAYKNHLHSTRNPYSQFQDKYTLEEIQKSQAIHGPLTKLQCCPTSDGAAAAVICSEAFMLANNLQDQAVEIIGMSLTTDNESTFQDRSLMNIAGYDMSKRAADKVYQQAGVQPSQVQVCELHDCFSANELITYEALGLCAPGKAGEFIDKGDNTYGGKVVVNPSGGLISKGHPLGATGLAQCSELCWQLRGMAEQRQVPNVEYALQHNIGLGGACVVVLYKKYNNANGNPKKSSSNPQILEQKENQKAKL
ncbi:sterol carrier protein 2 [Paramecium bursaria]